MNFGTIVAVLAIFFLWFTSLAAYVTHVVVSIQSEQWFLLLFGMIAFPVGIIHGIGNWFGAF